MERIAIRYYNVMFYLKIRTDRDLFQFQVLGDRIKKGERLHMKDISSWCRGHGIEYYHRFSYRRDFPISANLWNFYSYIRFQLDQNQ